MVHNLRLNLFLDAVFNCIVLSFGYFVLISFVPNYFLKQETTSVSSSVWCQTNGNGDKKCTFQNLCYNSKFDFVFVLTKQSIISGLKEKQDFKKIKTSSVLNHNGMYLKVSIILPDNPILKKMKIIRNPVFLLWRFKPDNIMHIIHDDLLPLYLTYSELCAGDIPSCVSKYQLAFIDGFPKGAWADWYKIFSKQEPILLRDLSQDTTVCFENSQTGLNEDSVFFQYGFKIPQGPVETNISGTLIRDFSEFILANYGMEKKSKFDSYKCLFIIRQLNRIILNEKFIENKLKLAYENVHRDHNFAIEKLDLAFNSTEEILASLASSKIIIGMHGSAMLLSMFLPKGATAIELFPFGISAKDVSPLYAMSRIPGIYLKYFSWTNTNETNTLAHPEYPQLWGGIYHLSTEQQEEIVSTKEVHAVECCHDPSYLYRMYQDTIVDDTIVPLLEKAIIEPLHLYDEFLNTFHLQRKWYFPGPVNNLTCFFLIENTLAISWDHPINIENFEAEYRLSVSVKNQDYFISTNSTSITIHLNNSGIVEVWIVCVINGDESLTTYMRCPNEI